MGQVVTLLCTNYFYTGKLIAIDGDNVTLENPSIVYETGEWSKKDWSDAQKLPNTIHVMRQSIEAFGIMK